MSAREELIEIVARDPISSGGDEIWATDLVDAFKAEVLREAAAKQREALTEDPGLSEAALIDLIDPDKDTE